MQHLPAFVRAEYNFLVVVLLPQTLPQATASTRKPHVVVSKLRLRLIFCLGMQCISNKIGIINNMAMEFDSGILASCFTRAVNIHRVSVIFINDLIEFIIH